MASLTWHTESSGSAQPDSVVFVLSGEMDREHVSRLQDLLALEGQARIVLDLHDVTLVDREAVQYLASGDAARVQIVNCPDYVRRWIVGEKRQNNRRKNTK